MIKQTILKDAFNDFTKYIDEDSGFLHINGVVARTGIQDYLALELGDSESDPMKALGVYRPKEEVLSEDSLKTFVNSPITDNHPKEFVNIDNAKELIKGSVSSIETFSKDGIDYIKAKMTITDKSLINKIVNGKVEISAGYSQDLIKEKGEFQGKSYDYKQTNIKINHIAVVDAGRCGNSCKILTDNNSIIDTENSKKGNLMPQITIDNVTHEITDCVAKHISSLNARIKSLDEEIAKKDEELVEKAKDVEKLEGEKAKLEEDMEEEKAKTTDSLINSLVDEKVALIDVAKTLNVTVDTKISNIDIKKAVIAANSKISLDGKSNEFIDGVYEMVLASTVGKTKAIKDSQSNAFDGFDGKPQGQTTNDAYAKYVENLKNAHKGVK